MSDPASRGRPTVWKGDLLFALVVLVLFGALVLIRFPGVLRGELIGTDSYMRLVRVRQLAESGAWFDVTIPRSNAPFGSTLHWTRPLDVLLLLGAGLGSPFLGFGRALHLAGVLVSPVLLIAICFVTAWSVRPLAGPRVRYYTTLAVLAQLGIMGYALPGRADQSMLILLVFVAMQGTAIRLSLAPDSRRVALATGALAAVGLWISVEFLVALLAVLAALLAQWIVKGAELANAVRFTTLGLFLGVAAAVLLEHPPMALLAAEYDRISIVHVFVTALIAMCGIVAAGPRASALGIRGRIVAAAAGTLVATALVLLVYPRFLAGPMADVNPELRRTWLGYLTEFQPYLVPHGLSGWGRFLAYLGQALLALGAVAYALRRDGRTARAGAWASTAVGLALFVPLAVRWVRFAMYAELLGVMGTMVLLSEILERIETRIDGARLARARAATSVGLIVGPLFLGAGLMALGGESGEVVQEAAATQTGDCPVETLVSALSDPGGLGGRPRTVLAHVDLGPLILYRTPHAVVATPYHRNWQGILDWQAIMTTRDPSVARRLIGARQVDVVVSCGTAPGGSAAALDTMPAFAELLSSGTTPPWLRPLPVREARGALRIYEVSLRP